MVGAAPLVDLTTAGRPSDVCSMEGTWEAMTAARDREKESADGSSEEPVVTHNQAEKDQGASDVPDNHTIRRRKSERLRHV